MPFPDAPFPRATRHRGQLGSIELERAGLGPLVPKTSRYFLQLFGNLAFVEVIHHDALYDPALRFLTDGMENRQLTCSSNDA